MKLTYAEQLKDPRWQKKRLEVLERDAWTCSQCRSTEKQLHVHHRYYVAHRFAWEYPPFCYQTVCHKCHDFLKDCVEARREEGDTPMWDEWEHGLNFFGEDIFEMAFIPKEEMAH